MNMGDKNVNEENTFKPSRMSLLKISPCLSIALRKDNTSSRLQLGTDEELNDSIRKIQDDQQLERIEKREKTLN